MSHKTVYDEVEKILSASLATLYTARDTGEILDRLGFAAFEAFNDLLVAAFEDPACVDDALVADALAAHAVCLSARRTQLALGGIRLRTEQKKAKTR